MCAGLNLNFINIFVNYFSRLRYALGAQWAVDSAQWAVFLTFLFVCRLEFKFHKHFCKLFLKIKVCIGCTVGFRQRTVSCFSNFFVCEARQL